MCLRCSTSVPTTFGLKRFEPSFWIFGIRCIKLAAIYNAESASKLPPSLLTVRRGAVELWMSGGLWYI